MRWLLILVSLVLIAGACGSEAAAPVTSVAAPTTAAVSSTSTTGTTYGEPDEPTTTATEAPEPSVCGQLLEPGFSEIECEDMVFDVAIPETCLERSCGLIVDVHGKWMSGSQADGYTDMKQLGNDAGYIVVQPSSPESEWDYEADTPRIRSFLDQLVDGLDVDRDRVHIGGFSQGAYITWMFICDHADLIASAAPLSARATADASPPSQDVDILLMHGRNDPVIPFESALIHRDALVEAWNMADSEEVLAAEPSYQWTRWTSAQGTVFELVEFDWEAPTEWGGHCYPGSAGPYVGCGDDTPVDYGEAALEFYIAHPKSD